MPSAPSRLREAVSISDRNTLPSSIAWISVCLLAAGTGPRADPFLQNLWIIFGLFGLTAALGLDVLDRNRRRDLRRKQRRVIQQRLDLELSRTAAGDVNPTEIRNILRRLASQDPQQASPAVEQRLEHRLFFNRPVRIRPLSPHEADSDESLEREMTGWFRNVSQGGAGLRPPDTEITGWLRDISADGIGLRHDEPLPKGPIKITIDLQKEERVALIADVTWCERQPNGIYYSGCRLDRVVTIPESSPPVPVHAG